MIRPGSYAAMKFWDAQGLRGLSLPVARPALTGSSFMVEALVDVPHPLLWGRGLLPRITCNELPTCLGSMALLSFQATCRPVLLIYESTRRLHAAGSVAGGDRLRFMVSVPVAGPSAAYMRGMQRCDLARRCEMLGCKSTGKQDRVTVFHARHSRIGRARSLLGI